MTTARRSPFTGVLAALARQRGVLGSIVVGELDGIVVDSQLQMGVEGDTVAALTASLFRKARLAAADAGLGEAVFLQLEAESGRVCAVGRNELVILAIAEARANVGLLRVELLRGLEALA